MTDDTSATLGPRLSLAEHAAAWTWGAAVGAFFVYTGLLYAQRTPYWCGVSPLEWVGLALGALVLGGIALLFGELAIISARRLLRLSRGRGIAAPVGALVAAALIWWHLLDVPEGHGAPDATQMALLAAGAALAVLAHAAGFMPAWVGGLLLSFALTAGVLSLDAAGRSLLLSFYRAEQATAFSLLWAIACGAGMLCAWGLKRGGAPALRLAAAGAVLIALPSVGFHVYWKLDAPREGAGPNLILLTADAMRADYCSVYGGDVPTPAMEGLARRGVRFERAYTAAPHTGPALFSILKAKYPPVPLPDEDVAQYYRRTAGRLFDTGRHTFAERLLEHDYATAVFNGNDVLSAWPGRQRFVRGFRHSRQLSWQLGERMGLFAQMPAVAAYVNEYFPNPKRNKPMDTTRRLREYARAFMRVNRGRPFFLWAHFMDPHTPYSPPARLRPDGVPWAFWPPQRDPLADWDEAREFAGAIPEALEDVMREARRLYEAEIRYVDEAYAAILGELAALGLDDVTYVCLSADHGEEFFDHGAILHGSTFYDEVIRVPLLFAGPTVTPGTVTEPVSLVDLLPTFFELAEMAPDPTWHGTSLAPVLRDPEHAERPSAPCFAWGTFESAFQQRPPERMIVRGDYKLIHEITTGALELYHLGEDPAEQTNLATERPGIAAELLQELDSKVAAMLQATPHPLEPGEHGVADMEENLRALGYL